MPAQPLRISLCTTCFRSHWQLAITTGPNLAHLWPHRRYTRWVVVLVADTEGEADASLEVLMELYGPWMAQGLLRVCYATHDRRTWHASAGKNTSHLAAIDLHRRLTPEIPDTLHMLINVDCDNVVGKGFVGSVVEQCTGRSPVRGPGAGGCAPPPGPRTSGGRLWRGGGMKAPPPAASPSRPTPFCAFAGMTRRAPWG